MNSLGPFDSNSAGSPSGGAVRGGKPGQDKPTKSAHPLSTKPNSQKQKPEIGAENSGSSKAVALAKQKLETSVSSPVQDQNSWASVIRNGPTMLYNGSTWLCGKSIERFAFFRAGLGGLINAKKTELSTLSGNENLAHLLCLLGEKAASEAAIPFLKGEDGSADDDLVSDRGRIPAFFYGSLAQMGSLSPAFQSIFLHAAINIAKKMREEDGHAHNPIDLVTLTSFLFKAVGADLNLIPPDCNSEDKLKFLQALNKKILALLFPGGSGDLPLVYGVRNFAWKMIESTTFDYIRKMEASRKFHELQKKSPSDTIKDSSCRLALDVVDSVKDYMKTDSLGVAKMIIGESGASDLTKEIDRPAVIKFLSSQLEKFAKTENEGINDAFKLAASTIETTLVQVLTYLSQGKKQEEAPVVAIITKLLEQLSRFVEAQNKKPSQKQFIELIESYLTMMGLGGEESGIPELQREVFDFVFKKIAPDLVAVNYEKLLCPLVELFDSIKHNNLSSKGTEDSDGLFTFCKEVGTITAKKTPEWIKDQSKTIAESIASSLPTQSADFKNWVSLWIEGQIVEMVTSEDQAVNNVWHFIDTTVPIVIQYVVASLSDGEKEKDKVLFSAIINVLKEFYAFYEENSKTLIEKHKSLILAQKNPSEDPVFIAIFKPFCKSLMNKFGIGGGKKIPVPQLLQTTAESQLLSYAPQFCAKFYHDFSLLIEKLSVKDRSSPDSADEGMDKLTSLVSQKISGKIPHLLEDNCEEIADGIVDQLMLLKGGESDEAKKNLLKKWLTDQIRQIGPNLNKTHPELWILLGSSIETVLSHIFHNLSRDKVTGKEAGLFGTENVLGALKVFIKDNRDAIDKKWKELESKGLHDPEKFQNEVMNKDSEGAKLCKEYVELFVPLAESFQEMMGLSSMPGMFNVVFETIFKGAAPAQLAKIYRGILLPLNNLVETLLNPKFVNRRDELEKLTGGKRLANWCQEAGGFVGKDLPKYFADPDFSKDAADLISRQLVHMVATKEQSEPLEKFFKSHSEQLPEKWEGLEELQKLYQWAAKWVNMKIQASAGSEDEQIKKIWELAIHQVEAMLVEVALGLVGTPEPNQKKDVLFVAVDQVLNSFTALYQQHGKAIEDHLSKLVVGGKKPEEEQSFIDLFKPFSQSIIEKVSSEKIKQLGLSEEIRAIVNAQLEKQIPKVFASLYSGTVLSAGSREAVLMRIQQSIKPGTDKNPLPENGAAKTIERLARFCSSELIESLLTMTHIETDPKTGGGISTQLQDEIPSLKDPEVQKLWPQVQNGLSSFILEAIANRLESEAASGNPVDGTVVSRTLATLIKQMFVYTQEERDALDQASSIVDLYQQQKVFNKIFEKRSSTLISLLKASPKEGSKALPTFPLPPMFNDALWNSLEKSIIPKFLTKIYTDKVAGEGSANQSASKMNLRSPSKIRSTTCDVIASFVAQSVPATISLTKEAIAEDIYKLASDYLKHSGTNPDALAVDNYLKENQEQLVPEIAKALMEISVTANDVRSVTKESVKTVLLQAFSKISDRIDAFENPTSETYDKDFLLKMGIRQMSLVKDHFKRLNEATKKHKTKTVHTLSYETLVDDLVKSNSLHKGTPKSKEAMEARRNIKKSIGALKSKRDRVAVLKKYGFFSTRAIVRLKEEIKIEKSKMRKAKKILNQERTNRFFEPFTKDLLGLAGLEKADNLPFPSPLKEQIWEQLQKNVLPTVLMGIFESVLEPGTIDQMLVTVLETYNAPQPKEGDLRKSKPKDQAQKKLDKVCGELVAQIAMMIPHSFTKLAFKVDKVNRSVAEGIGVSIREQLSEKLSLQSIIDQALPSLLQSLGGGRLEILNESGIWVPFEAVTLNDTREMRFVPTKIGEDGQSVESEELNFNIPDDDDKEENAIKAKAETDLAVSKQARAQMIATAHDTIAQLLLSPLKAIIDTLLKLWNDAINKVFGRHAKSVVNFFQWIGFRMIYKLIKTLLIIAGSPILLVGWLANKIFWACMDRHLGKRVDDVMKTLHMEIHEDLLYKATSDLLSELKDGKSAEDTAALIERLSKEFERRQKEEEPLQAEG